MENEIVNKVAQSGIQTIDLEALIPEKPESSIDIKDQLFQGLVLKEKDFRTFVKEHNWEQYKGHRVAVYCSTDAIVPTWAYMLVAKELSSIDVELFFCQPENLAAMLAERTLSGFDATQYKDQRVVIKGCGDREISNHAYVYLSSKLIPEVKSLMFGEPCSTVPIFKKK